MGLSSDPWGTFGAMNPRDLLTRLTDLRRPQLAEPHSKQAGTKCMAPDCTRSTAERKPYCPAHVLMHPYAAQVAKCWASR